MAKPFLVPNHLSSLPMASEVTKLSGKPPPVFSFVKFFQAPFANQLTPPPSVVTQSSRFSPIARPVMGRAFSAPEVLSAVNVCQSPYCDKRVRPLRVPNHLLP